MRIDLFFAGYVHFELNESDGAQFFEACRALDFSPKAPKRDEKNGKIRFFCTWRAAKRLQAADLPLRELSRGGLPYLFCAFPARPGVLCGIFCALLLLLASQFFLFDVRVEGNEKISTDELLAALEEVGVARGCFLPTLSEDEASLSLRRLDGRVAFAAVNIRGNVAHVQIREAVTHAPPVTAPANLVAKCDGVVVMPIVFEGRVLVREGEIVRAGQLLASGILDSEKHGYRVTRAAGQVLARTTHTYTVTVPFAYEQRVPTGDRGFELTLHFFGLDIKVFKSTRNLTKECDIIERAKWLTLKNGASLPLGYTLIRADAQTSEPATRSVGEARAQAFAELEAQLAADSAGRTLLSRTVEIQPDADGITLVCTVVCEEDIARVCEFEVAN